MDIILCWNEFHQKRVCLVSIIFPPQAKVNFCFGPLTYLYFSSELFCTIFSLEITVIQFM